jgi:conjugative transfer signal peptidase TraF
LITNFKQGYTLVALLGISVLAVMAVLYFLGVRINTTKSIPLGLYLTSKQAVEKGAYVFFCPPDNEIFATAKKRNYITSGFCPGGYGYLMKRIVATEGDVVTTSRRGVSVNGQLLPYSQLRTADLGGRPLPRWPLSHYTLEDSELLLMSDVSDTSFDGRYFGPVARSQIRSVIQPFITW